MAVQMAEERVEVSRWVVAWEDDSLQWMVPGIPIKNVQLYDLVVL